MHPDDINAMPEEILRAQVDEVIRNLDTIATAATAHTLRPKPIVPYVTIELLWRLRELIVNDARSKNRSQARASTALLLARAPSRCAHRRTHNRAFASRCVCHRQRCHGCCHHHNLPHRRHRRHRRHRHCRCHCCRHHTCCCRHLRCCLHSHCHRHHHRIYHRHATAVATAFAAARNVIFHTVAVTGLQ